MIRLTESVMLEVQKRGCSPLESFVFGLRLQMWPLFQKAMSDQVDALKKLAEGAGGGYFRRAVETTDASVNNVRVTPTTQLPRSTQLWIDMQTIHRALPIICYANRADRGNDDILQVSGEHLRETTR